MADAEAQTGSVPGEMRDNPEALAALAMAAFSRAKRVAIAENDRLGVPSYGVDEEGGIVVRQPAAGVPANLA